MERIPLRCYRGGCGAPVRACNLVGRKKRRGGALFEIAECEDAGAQLRERAVLGQCHTADLLRRLSFATSFDLAPVVLRIPVPVRPMLHLVSSPCLHLLPPMLRAAARVQIVFGDNRASRANYCEFLSRCVAAFASWLRRARPPSVARSTLGPACLRFINASEAIAFPLRRSCSSRDRGDALVAPGRARQFAAAPVYRGLAVAAGPRRPTWLPPFAAESPSIPRRARPHADQGYARRISPSLRVRVALGLQSPLRAAVARRCGWCRSNGKRTRATICRRARRHAVATAACSKGRARGRARHPAPACSPADSYRRIHPGCPRTAPWLPTSRRGERAGRAPRPSRKRAARKKRGGDRRNSRRAGLCRFRRGSPSRCRAVRWSVRPVWNRASFPECRMVRRVPRHDAAK